jgi:hypothetical protein
MLVQTKPTAAADVLARKTDRPEATTRFDAVSAVYSSSTFVAQSFPPCAAPSCVQDATHHRLLATFCTNNAQISKDDGLFAFGRNVFSFFVFANLIAEISLPACGMEN